MIITDEKLKGSIEDKMAIADSFNLMDDDFFAIVGDSRTVHGILQQKIQYGDYTT